MCFSVTAKCRPDLVALASRDLVKCAPLLKIKRRGSLKHVRLLGGLHSREVVLSQGGPITRGTFGPSSTYGTDQCVLLSFHWVSGNSPGIQLTRYGTNWRLRMRATETARIEKRVSMAI